MGLFWFYLIFYGALALGVALRRWQDAAPRIMRLTILWIDAPLFFISYWMLDLTQLRLYAPIPVLATVLVLVPLFLSPALANKLFSKKTSQGSFVLSAAFSNIGTTGGSFLCYLLFGLPGLSLGYLFLFPYPILIFVLGFSAAKRYSCDCRLTFRDYLSNITTNAISLVPLVAIALGLCLNAVGMKPPANIAPWVDVWIKAGLGLMCLAIGMTLVLRRVFAHLPAITTLSAIKFLGLPALALVLVFFSFGSLASIPARVVMIQSFMPPAIYAVITANLFGLDRELANSLWFSTSLLLLPIAALLFILFG